MSYWVNEQASEWEDEYLNLWVNTHNNKFLFTSCCLLLTFYFLLLLFIRSLQTFRHKHFGCRSTMYNGFTQQSSISYPKILIHWYPRKKSNNSRKVIVWKIRFCVRKFLMKPFTMVRYETPWSDAIKFQMRWIYCFP